MKAAAFGYVRAGSVEEALTELAVSGTVALAGGQSLVPLMARRQVRPERVCDLNRLPELSRIEVGSEQITLGAMVRQADLEEDAGVARALPIVPMAMQTLGFAATRHRGTVGGSLCFADPCAELPALAVLLEARVVLQRPGVERELPADEFLIEPYRCALLPGELLTALIVPRSTANRCGAVKLRVAQERPVGAQTTWSAGAAGEISDPRVVLFDRDRSPRRLTGCEALLADQQPGLELFHDSLTDPADSLPAGHRGDLARAAVVRALLRSVEDPDVRT
jgi:carbon-monoxide dehydrogenase medium subunit